MNPTTAPAGLSRLIDQGVSLAQSQTQATWLAPLRQRALDRIQDLDLPNRSQEGWRYTSLGFLEQSDYQPQSERIEALQLEDIQELLWPHEGHRLVFVNGQLAEQLCYLKPMQSGIEISNLAGDLSPASEELRNTLLENEQGSAIFEALNAALMTDGALIKIGSEVRSEVPIELLHISVGLEQAPVCHPRHLIWLQAGAQAQVTERYCSLGESCYFTNAAVQVLLDQGSQLQHVRIQQESSQAQHLTDLQVRQHADSHYRLVQAGLGASWSRSDIVVQFSGENAEARLDGLMLAGDQQLTDVHLDVRHEVPGCRSEERFKGILDGKGRVVFDGRILVARDAQQTDAQLSNDNLMLSRSAEVDTKPQLEIFADDVKCSHGTTVGELDQNQLFYLRSRGIPADRAIQMLCQGFAQEILDQLPSETQREQVIEQLAQRLQQDTTA